MVERTSMARLQLLVPPELKDDIETWAGRQNMSVNEAMRVLVRRGLAASAVPLSASGMVDDLGHLVRALEATVAAQRKQ